MQCERRFAEFRHIYIKGIINITVYVSKSTLVDKDRPRICASRTVTLRTVAMSSRIRHEQFIAQPAVEALNIAVLSGDTFLHEERVTFRREGPEDFRVKNMHLHRKKREGAYCKFAGTLEEKWPVSVR